ncbi:hypothetical protein [Sediminimonas qiaohouensis]|uniref:hypothetical protein n=1 Tax=Sediminimonas qiaohouensis TaxID=552061 RepID=UPI0012ED2D0B|nr:hypothetical protein [Sediminimonas qiaohouensis]
MKFAATVYAMIGFGFALSSPPPDEWILSSFVSRVVAWPVAFGAELGDLSFQNEKKD